MYMYIPKIGIVACSLFGASVCSRSKPILALAMPKLDYIIYIIILYIIFYCNTKINIKFNII